MKNRNGMPISQDFTLQEVAGSGIYACGPSGLKLFRLDKSSKMIYAYDRMNRVEVQIPIHALLEGSL